MFKNKGVKITKKQVMVEPKVSNPSIHMVDVNMAIIRNKVTEEQMFKDRKPIKKNFVVDWEEEQSYNNLSLRLYRKCKQKTHQKI
jgi:hypothetical protein